MPDRIKEEILSKINFESFYRSHGLVFSYEQGQEWKAPCPFHDDEDPSLCVNIEKGMFHCKGCGKGGSFFDFYLLKNGMNRSDKTDYIKARNEIAESLGIKVQKYEDKKRGRKKIDYPHLNEEALKKLIHEMNKTTIGYLNERGINSETIEKLQLGRWGNSVVFPIRKNGKLCNYRFKNIKNGDQFQLPKDTAGKQATWIFPEPNPDEEEILLCEGEIDTLNAISLGYHAVCITGGAGTWIDELLPFFKGKKVFLCYDVDEKGRISAKKIGNKISKVVKEAKIIKLDLDLDKYPKGDLNDYFVKEKKTLQEFNKLIRHAETVLTIDKDIKVFEDEGCYWSTKEGKDGIEIERISNFVIRLYCRYKKQDDSTSREIVFISRFNGKVSNPRIVEPNNMSDARSFREFCYSAGDFIYSGDTKHLSDIWQLIIAQDPTSKEVHSAFKIGYVERLGVWLFENMAIKDNQLLLPDENGICWNGNMGYSPQPIEVKSAETIVRMPKLIPTKENNFELIKEFSRKLTLNIGNYDCLYGLGLVCGSVYFGEIIKEFGCFPILWIYGRLQCGKNEYAGFLMRLFGLGRNDCESLPELRSTVPITRKLSYFSHMPVWYDEYRNQLPSLEMFRGTFRSAYNASGRSLGVKDTQGVVTERTNASIIISGEELPDDEALMSRLVIVKLNINYRKDEYYNEVFNLSEMCSSHILHLIKNKNKDSTKKLIEKIKEYREQIYSRNKTANRRVVMNYAIMLGCYTELVGENELLNDYVIHGPAISGRYDYNPDGMNMSLNEFIDGVSVLVSKQRFEQIGWYKFEKDHINIWLEPIYSEWSKEYRQSTGEAAPNKRSLLDNFKETDFFVDNRRKCRIIDPVAGNPIRSCLVLDITKMPTNIQSWFKNEE